MTSWDGNRAIQLTSSPDNEHRARWSPDGEHLAFLSSRTSEEDGEQVWLMNRAGGEATKITEIKGAATLPGRRRRIWPCRAGLIDATGERKGAGKGL
jgi:Tol biopolymer transport system component